MRKTWISVWATVVLWLLPGWTNVHGQEDTSATGKGATKEEIAEVKEALNGLSESFTEYRNYVDALRKIKITGYLQPQWRGGDVIDQRFTVGGFSGGGFPANTKSAFQVRRGRVKVMYDNVLTQFVIQIDAIQTGFTTKDAYVLVTEPWTQSLGFQMGIFDRPFGYEISYSSSSRESPERSRMYQTLFPGERELGAKLFYAPQLGPLSFLRADVGLFNGSGPSANEFDNFKDVIGHVAAQFPMDGIGGELDLGVSGYLGNVRNNTKYVYTSGDIGVGQGFAVDSTAENLGSGVARTYVGMDAQFYLDIPGVGGAILRGEYITGKQPGNQATSQSFSNQPLTPLYQRNFGGFYVYYVQNIGTREQVVVKYDVYDPNTKVTAGDFTAANTSGARGLSANDIKYSTLGLGFIHHLDDNIKVVLFYEWVRNEELTALSGSGSSLAVYGTDVPDNVFTLRVQYKF
jgi:hypothetical protein